jgi:hypothetical protein
VSFRADQDTDLSEMLKIRNVPLFQFYRDNELLEQFATRDKERIGNAINRSLSPHIFLHPRLNDKKNDTV